jgi:lipopolysaccharide transport protein LptA
MRTGSLIRARSTILPLMLLAGMQSGPAGSLDFNSDDTIMITAERGWEGDETNVIHFSGNFALQAPDWSMAGDTAVVYGKMDNPDRVVVEGSPARILFLRNDDENPEDAGEQDKVKGAANSIEYLRATDKLIMRGDVSLFRQDSELTGQMIEYDVDTDRYSATGESGINFQFNPKEDQ